MRTFRIIEHNLDAYQNAYDWKQRTYIHREIPPHMKVCSSRSLSAIGIVISTSEPVARPDAGYGPEFTRVMQATVLWLTGPHKGKTQVKNVEQLADYNGYKEAVRNHLEELEDTEKEAAETGM